MSFRLFPSRPRGRRTALTVLLAAVLSLPAPLTPLAAAAELPGRPDVPATKSARVLEVTSPQAKAARAKVAREKKANQRLVDSARKERQAAWPGTSVRTEDLTRTPRGEALVRVKALKHSSTSRQARALASGKAKITVLDQKATRRAGVTGVIFTVAAESPGAAQVTVDYSSFASAIGGNWSSRLGLVTLPPCALTTPQKQRCRATTVQTSDNDIHAETVTSRTTLAGTSAAAPTVMALTATSATTSSAGVGDFNATPLAASASWQAGTSSGAFTWSYPISTPPAAAGPAPSLALSYDSGSIDGRTANTNNQGSLLGEGFDLTSSYVERTYGSCEDDGQTGKSDLCWKYDNASLVLNGKATELVKDDTTGVWHLKDDDASKVTRLTDADNGDNDGEYWKIVTSDGTTYTFGLNKLAGAGSNDRTNSVWTVPVFGDDDREPGYDKGTAFADRALTQAWRWNLDMVEDVHGNASTYWYKAETNYYPKNGDKTALALYTRGGYLEEIRYGQRADTLFSSPVSDKVTFTYKERCTASDCSSLTKDTADNWPDVPFDAICSASESDCKSAGPSFFTRKRLTSIDTFYWSRAAEPDAFQAVDSYTFDQKFFDGQDIGNSSDQVLTLVSLIRTGKNGTAIAVPPVEFTYQQRPNRVEGGTQPGGGSIAALTRPRIASILSETGAITSVTLSDPECVRGTKMPTAEDDNDLSCYPVYWPINGGDPQLDWFHKYRVTSITTNDPGAGNPGTQTSYDYSTPGWHYNDDPFTKEKERTWSVWRGYQKVTTYTGDPGTTRSQTVKLFMQGMNGDKRKDGTTRTAVVKGIDLDNVAGNDPATTLDDLDVADANDDGFYAGQLRQEITYDGATAISTSINDLWSKETASQQKSYANIKAHFVNTARTYRDAYLTAAQKWRVAATSYTYDTTYGMTTTVQDDGNWSATGDETCTRTWYARNDAKGLTALVSRTRMVAKPCANTDDNVSLPANSGTRGDVLGDTAVVYDNASTTGWSPGQVPTLGLPTWTGRAKAYPAASGTADRNPPAATGWQTLATTAYDTDAAKLGRPLKVTDAKGRTTTTTYYPAAAGPLATLVVTAPRLASNNQAHQTTTNYDPARGTVNYVLDANTKRTENTYDALGRITNTWLPNRSRSGNDSPNAKYGYGLERDKAPWTSVAKLKADGTSYETAYALYDSQLRPIQTQVSSPQGGRVLTDTRYDSRGLAYETYEDVYDSSNAPNSTYTQAPYGGATQTQTQFDGAGRATTSTLLVDGVKKWSTTATYTGDSVATTAVEGGNATRTIIDILGRTAETRTYAGTQPNDSEYGASSATPYTRVRNAYTRDGKPDTITGPDNTKWTYTYDLFGRQVNAADPDGGTTKTTYTDLDQIDTTTDDEDHVLLYDYDELGRKNGLWQTSRTAANQLAAWTYDSILKGLPTASIRYENGTTGKAYTKQVTAYDTLGQPTATTLTLPSDDPLVTSGAVTATTTFETAYRLDGTVNNTKEPAAGGLPAETLEYRYNSAGLNNELSGASGYLLAANYTAFGEVSGLQLGTSTASGTKRVFLTNDYEKGTRRLIKAAVDDQTRGPVQDLTYSYDQAGNVTSVTDSANIGTGTDNQCFTYDSYRRLTEAWTPKTTDCAASGRTAANLGGPAPYWTTYTYTASGQRETEKQNTGTPVTTTSCYDTARPHALTATTTAGTCTGLTRQYQYDDTGNTEKRVKKAGSTTSQTLAWNAEGRLTSVTDDTAATATNYVYGADGELLIRRDNATNGETVLYLGATEVHLKTSKKWANRYYAAAGATIAMRTNESGTETLSFLAADHHGTSSISITGDSNQTLSKRYSTPFGTNRGQTTGVWPDDKAFLGMAADPSTGLTHIGAREYDPSTGQFISVDPELALDQHQTLNGYAYAGNNPVTLSDPTGRGVDDGTGHSEPNPGHAHGNQSPTPGIPAGGTGPDGCYHTCGSSSSSDSTSDGASGGTSTPGPTGTPTCGVVPLAPCGVIPPGPVAGPAPTNLPYIPPGIAHPDYLKARECATVPILLTCNPEDAVLGGGGDDLRMIGLKWFAGVLDGATTYGEDSRVALQVMMSDITAAQRKEIIRLWTHGKLEGSLEPYSIGAKDSVGKIRQFLSDQWSIASGDRNAATGVLGSYTAKYKILRANSTGIQARITIENNMTMSSFAHIATGYGTAADRFVQRYDNDGVVAGGNAATSHYMTITFRVVIPS
ncbi:RHS repeat-associated core domain-containing protein [Streptomyces sp. NPDC007095]|uniref:RHS repeat-associated core domain-containing protein n=1 Tax=Streptomyces sp. NPDC007095 TaxID=3154482 RepID=UPI0033E3C064